MQDKLDAYQRLRSKGYTDEDLAAAGVDVSQFSQPEAQPSTVPQDKYDAYVNLRGKGYTDEDLQAAGVDTSMFNKPDAQLDPLAWSNKASKLVPTAQQNAEEEYVLSGRPYKQQYIQGVMTGEQEPPVLEQGKPEDEWTDVVSKGVPRGLQQAGGAIAGAGRMVSEVVPPIKPYVDTAAEYYGRKVRENAPEVEQGSAKDYAGKIVESTMQSIPAIALSPAVGLPLFGAMGAGQSWNEDRPVGAEESRGVGKGMAAGRAAVGGALEWGTELLPTKYLWEMGGKNFIKQLGKLFGADLAGEEVNTIGNWVKDKITTRPDITLGELVDQMKETGIIATGQSLLLGGAAKGVSSAVGQQAPPPDTDTGQPIPTPTPDELAAQQQAAEGMPIPVNQNENVPFAEDVQTEAAPPVEPIQEAPIEEATVAETAPVVEPIPPPPVQQTTNDIVDQAAAAIDNNDTVEGIAADTKAIGTEEQIANSLLQEQGNAENVRVDTQFPVEAGQTGEGSQDLGSENIQQLPQPAPVIPEVVEQAPTGVGQGVDVTTQKQPWEMTANEHKTWMQSKEYDTNLLNSDSARSDKIGEIQQRLREETNFEIPAGELEHKAEVILALSEGKPVPPEVLADYPELTEQKAPPVKEQQPATIDINTIPPDMTVSVKWGNSDKPQVMKAHRAVKEKAQQIANYETLLNCLRGPAL